MSEYRCDDNAVKNYSDTEKIGYVETLRKMAVAKTKTLYECNAVGFANVSKKSSLISRADRVLGSHDHSIKHASLILAGIALFLLSYTAQIQPSYDAPYIEGEIEVTADNAYLKPTPDGYALYVNDDILDYIDESELSMEPFTGLEIRP